MPCGSSRSRPGAILDLYARRWNDRPLAADDFVLSLDEKTSSILQRKALTRNDFASLADVEDRTLGFQQHWEAIATPFHWRFTKDDLRALIRKLDVHAAAFRPAA